MLLLEYSFIISNDLEIIPTSESDTHSVSTSIRISRKITLFLILLISALPSGKWAYVEIVLGLLMSWISIPHFLIPIPSYITQWIFVRMFTLSGIVIL